MSAHLKALENSKFACFWLDQDARPEPLRRDIANAIHVIVRRSSDKTELLSGFVGFAWKSPLRWSAGLPAGSYVIEARSLWGRQATGELSIDESSRSVIHHELRLR